MVREIGFGQSQNPDHQTGRRYLWPQRRGASFMFYELRSGQYLGWVSLTLISRKMREMPSDQRVYRYSSPTLICHCDASMAATGLAGHAKILPALGDVVSLWMARAGVESAANSDLRRRWHVRAITLRSSWIWPECRTTLIFSWITLN